MIGKGEEERNWVHLDKPELLNHAACQVAELLVGEDQVPQCLGWFERGPLLLVAINVVTGGVSLHLQLGKDVFLVLEQTKQPSVWRPIFSNPVNGTHYVGKETLVG
jgi:hypothetical protein